MTFPYYGSLTLANEYFSEQGYSSAWSAFTNNQKLGALKRATKMLDRIPFRGKKLNLSQDKEFPRVEHLRNSTWIYHELDTVTGSIDVPKDVLYATFEQAYYLLDRHDTDERIWLLRNGIPSASMGSTSETFDFEHSPIHMHYHIVKEAWVYLEKYLLVGA